MKPTETMQAFGSTLTVQPTVIPGVSLGEANQLPPIHRLHNVQRPIASRLGEEDGLFLNYGACPGVFPYSYQDNYDRELSDRAFQAVILENQYLRAEFFPELGGRLWSLFDKRQRKELLFCNSVFRLGNLANRNAWFSGGVEFNFGPVGHHPHTCECMHTALLSLPDGTPVLRMYQFERIRAVAYQMDFFLPSESSFLFARVRLVNPNPRVTPVYWWSNIAVPARPENRVITGADSAYSQNSEGVYRLDIPFHNGIDITYPENNPGSVDYFWNIPENRRKYIAYPDRDGHGLLQCSTGRLRGRKLFVWGQTEGSLNWQRFLSGNGDEGRYAEIQAGLAKTQYESLPMPPSTAWEWLEAYGALDAEPALVHGEWKSAQAHVEADLERRLPLQNLEKILEDTGETAKRPADKKLLSGSAWGTLENLRRSAQGEAPICPHLDFGSLGPEQEYWAAFLKNGRFPEGERTLPISYMAQPEWRSLLEQSFHASGHWDWELPLHLGLIALSENNFEDSQKYLSRSMELKRNPGALFGLSVYYELTGDMKASADFSLSAARMLPTDLSFAKAAAQRLLNAGENQKLLAYLDETPWLLGHSRIRLVKAHALLETGDPEGAEAILMEKGGLIVPDIREGELSVTKLWFDIQQAMAEQRGEKLDSSTLCPPSVLDFRAALPKKSLSCSKQPQ